MIASPVSNANSFNFEDGSSNLSLGLDLSALQTEASIGSDLVLQSIANLLSRSRKNRLDLPKSELYSQKS